MLHARSWPCCLLFCLCFSQLCFAIYHWNGEECVKIFAEETAIRGTGCVAEGSLPNASPYCKRCAYDYQCEGGWCQENWKLCYYPSIGGCYTHNNISAQCKGCPSDRRFDVSTCVCGNPDFPNNWVTCTDGTNVTDTYSTMEQYTREEDTAVDGLTGDDTFAMYVQCYHNKYRELMGLVPLEWNVEIAAFAKFWTRYLRDNDQCDMKHSSGDQRANLGGFENTGENMWKVWMGKKDMSINTRWIADFGRKSTMSFINEVRYFQYAGDDGGAFDCPFRNADDGYPMIGHFTQCLWHETTTIGCDYVLCPKDDGKVEALVSCGYGPAGNWPHKSPFNDTAFCFMNDIQEFSDKWGEAPRCDGRNLDCDNMDGWTTPIPPPPDGKCPTVWDDTCSFPYQTSWGTVFQDCTGGTALWGAPWCFNSKGDFDLCPDDSIDPDCYNV